MLIFSFCNFFTNEYNVDDFPLPVGPLIIRTPFGLFIIFSINCLSSSYNPRFSMSILKFPAFKILITIFSPKITGTDATLMSTKFPL